MHPNHQRWHDTPTEEPFPNIQRQYVHGEQAMLARFQLKAGAIATRHAHPHEQITMVVTGRMRFLFGDANNPNVQEVGPGETVVIPGNLPHQAEALEDTLAFDVFAPPREDWMANKT